MRNKKWTKPLTMCLTLAMAFSVAAVRPDTVSTAKGEPAADSLVLAGEAATPSAVSPAATGSATVTDPVAAELAEIVKKNQPDFYSLTKADNRMVQKFTMVDEQDRLIEFASEKKADKYCLVDINDDTVDEILALKGKKLIPICFEDDGRDSGKKGSAFKNFKEAKKVGASVIIKTVKGKKTTYTVCTCTDWKLKKGDVYVVNGKRYTINGKKASAKKFKKFIKSYNKKKPLKFTEMPAYSTGIYQEADWMFISKELMVRHNFTQEGEDTVVFRYDPKATDAKYKAFGRDERGAKRYVFGPDVAAPDGKTYLEKDYADYALINYCIGFFIGFVDNPAKVDFSTSLSDDLAPSYGKVPGEPYVYSKKTGAMYKTDMYSICYSDTVIEIQVFNEGPAKGMICEADIRTSTDVVTDYWRVYFGEEAEEYLPEGEIYEPGSEEILYGTTSVGTPRELKIGGKYPYTEKTVSDCRFKLHSHYGRFSAAFNGETINYKSTDEVIYKKFEDAINPPAGTDGEYLAPTIKDLTWTVRE